MKALLTWMIIGSLLYVGISHITRWDGQTRVDTRVLPDLERWAIVMLDVGVDPDLLLEGVHTIEVGTILNPHVGAWSKGWKIKIDSRSLKIGPYSSRMILYHELGHAVFDWGHGPGFPELMHAELLDERYLQENWTRLEREYQIHATREIDARK
jgi:hypothetical protein